MKMTFILGWSREVNYKKKYLCEKSKPFVYCNRVEKSKYVNVIVEAKFEKKSAIGRCLLWRKRDKSCETVDDVSGQLLSSNLILVLVGLPFQQVLPVSVLTPAGIGNPTVRTYINARLSLLIPLSEPRNTMPCRLFLDSATWAT